MSIKRGLAAAVGLVLSVLFIAPTAAAAELGDCSDSIRRCHNACIWAVESGGSSMTSDDCQAACDNQFTENGSPAACSGQVVPDRARGDCSDSIRRCHNACIWAVETGGGSLPAKDCTAACTNQFTDKTSPALCALN